MPFPPSPASRPSLPIRALIWVAVPVLLVLGLVRSPFAQSAPGGYGPGSGPGMGRMRGGDRMGPPGGEHRTQVLEAIEGPLAPAVIQDSVGVSSTQLEEYARRYANLMAGTRPERDSLRTTMQTMRTAFEQGDRAAARNQRGTIERQSKMLLDRDKDFEKGLKDLLSKDQQKRYQKLRQNREKEARDRWQQDQPAPEARDGWTYRPNGR
jgi:hypothetical protein